jgi:hypothetical protein
MLQTNKIRRLGNICSVAGIIQQGRSKYTVRLCNGYFGASVMSAAPEQHVSRIDLLVFGSCFSAGHFASDSSFNFLYRQQ